MTAINELINRGNLSEAEHVALLREKQAILNEINNIRRDEISAIVESLRQRGIEIEYIPELNTLNFLQSPEEVDRILNSIVGATAEETNALRQGYKDMIAEALNINNAAQRTGTEWWNVEEAINSIGQTTKVILDDTMLYAERLGVISELLSRNSAEMAATNNVDRQAELIEERKRLLREEQSLLHKTNNARRPEIASGVELLGQHGIRIQYNPELNTLEFEKSVEEMQDIINSVDLGDAEATDALRQHLKETLSLIIYMNNANERNGTLWWDIERTVAQLNFDLINLRFNDFISEQEAGLERLSFQYNMLADNDFAGQADIINRRLEIQQETTRRATQELENLRLALLDGRITADHFREGVENVTRVIEDSTVAARRYTDTLAQITLNDLNAQLAASQAIVNLTMQMIRQEVNNQVADLQRRRQALRDLEQDLNDGLRDRNDLRRAEIDALNEALRLERERARDAQQALQDQLNLYRMIIELRRRELQRGSEDRRFEQDLEAAQREVQRIENRLFELQNNDSLSARAERARLEEELAQRQLQLDNLVFDNDIKNQDRALQDELERYNRENEAARRRIDDELRAFEEAHRQRLAMLDAERQAQEDAVAAQIDDLRRRGDAYDEEAERLRDSISRNGDLVRMAMERIDRDGEALYAQLIAWNERYGTGIREDISEAWEEFMRQIEIGNETTLDRTRRIMREILDVTIQLTEEQRRLNSLANGMQEFGPAQSQTPNTLAKAQSALKPGVIERLGVDSLVLPNDFTKTFSNAISSEVFGPHAPWMSSLTSDLNKTFGLQAININQEFHGVTSESFMKSLPNTMQTVADASIRNYNNNINLAAKRNGLR